LTAEGVFLAMTLLLLQVWRRLYECAFISITSPSAKINLIHYVVGYVHYFCAGAGILLEAPCFTPVSNMHHRVIRGFGWVSVDVNVKEVTVVQVLAITVFMWAWYHQKRAHSILADLRSGEDGSRGQLYRIPHGDWFRWVSCPHYLAEVITKRINSYLYLFLYGHNVRKSFSFVRLEEYDWMGHLSLGVYKPGGNSAFEPLLVSGQV
jgi:hypothetical protein